MTRYPLCIPATPGTPFSFSLLIDAPIHSNLPFSPVSAVIMPLALIDLPYAGLFVAGLDILIAFLAKRYRVQPPMTPPPPQLFPVTLTLAELAQLIQNASRGGIPFAANPPGQVFGPVGRNEPLFPDNLSFSLMVGTPLAPFDSSPDSFFIVPLFEVPGTPGNLIIALAILVIQFYIERSGISTVGSNPTPDRRG